jgi:hypothetical protein
MTPQKHAKAIAYPALNGGACAHSFGQLGCVYQDLTSLLVVDRVSAVFLAVRCLSL